MKTALVTAGTAGTGRAIAERFAREGVNVAITSRSVERAMEAAAEIAAKYSVICRGYALDQFEESSVLALYDALEADGLLPDAVVLNAADLGIGMNALTVSAADFARVITTNIVGEFLLIREAAVRHMIEQGKGAAVIIGSNTSRRAIRNRSAYCASKGGLVSLAKSLALDLGGYGIRVNAVLPGSIHSERWEAFDEETLAAKRARVPIGREAYPDDIAEAAYFLASDAASSISGTELIVDGGVDGQLFPGT
ncbi:MAG: SDR family oxidoreductase [Clostridia bacterium]|nr:SDR family oxidoreductase [Clostridia bacterium]